MCFHLVFLFTILQRNDEEAVVDRGGTRSILKTHFEKEDLEGKTFSPFGNSYSYLCFKEKCEICHQVENCNSQYQNKGGNGCDCFGATATLIGRPENVRTFFGRHLLNLYYIPGTVLCSNILIFLSKSYNELGNEKKK